MCSFQHLRRDYQLPATPLWETTAVQFPTPKARSTISDSTPLGVDSCAVSSTPGQSNNLQSVGADAADDDAECESVCVCV